VYPTDNLMISDGCAREVLSVGAGGAGGVPGVGKVGCGVRTLRQAGGGAPVPLCIQLVYGIFVVPCWQ
jgi:hypothetical protein